MLFVLALLLTAAPDPLAAAKQHLAKGELDEVLFAIQDAKKADPLKSAELLAEAARQSLEKKDDVFALQFVQMALKASPKNAMALEVGARASLNQQQFDPAEKYSDQWIAAEPDNARARLLRAEIAIENAEWSRVVSLLKDVEPAQLSTDDQARMRELLQKSLTELREREEARKERAGDALTEAIERVNQAQREQARKEELAAQAMAAKSPDRVTLYGASWCGYCKSVASWLRQRKIPFEERDIEKDFGAGTELEQKKAKAHMTGGGVPWTSIGENLIYGYDVPKLEVYFPASRFPIVANP